MNKKPAAWQVFIGNICFCFDAVNTFIIQLENMKNAFMSKTM